MWLSDRRAEPQARLATLKRALCKLAKRVDREAARRLAVQAAALE